MDCDKREILFRGKRLDNGEWRQGFLFKIREKAFILWGTINGIPDMTEVDPETVGQYTGIHDRNGKPIFEGDIVKTDLERPYNIVVFRNGCFLFNCNDGGEDYFDTIENISSPDVVQDGYWEVIGNIHDNPELKKK